MWKNASEPEEQDDDGIDYQGWISNMRIDGPTFVPKVAIFY